MKTKSEIRKSLLSLDGKGYKAYETIKGAYDFRNFELIIDHVQGDPFAAASRFRVRLKNTDAGFPAATCSSKSREVALRDFLTRKFAETAEKICIPDGTGKSGIMAIDRPGQEILERTSCIINDEFIEVRFVVGLPAQGRTILGKKAASMICKDLPQIVKSSMYYKSLDPEAVKLTVETAEDSAWLREQLASRGLAAFVADGAVLPRRTGIDDKPMKTGAVRFCAPQSLRVSFTLPNRGPISGMGVPRGITLIVGGGFHGKSTLLRALERGVYDHIPDDGRELVVTDPTAVKIRAEDGRSIREVCITPFISNLPGGHSTEIFSTDNASGSTSEAANIMEALEAGSKLLILDEDTSATNFMIRDRRMQVLITKDKEPITPFVNRVRQLYEEFGVSTILVMGGSGDYFDVADTVIAMENYLPADVSKEARDIAEELPTGRLSECEKIFGVIRHRAPLRTGFDSKYGSREVHLKVREVDEILYGSERIDLTQVEQLVDESQMRSIAQAVYYASRLYMDGKRSISEILDLVMSDIRQKSLDVISEIPAGNLAEFRRFEMAAAINRLRKLNVIQIDLNLKK